jgi:hypothetical protein
MRLWGEVWSADGTSRLGVVNLASCRVSRKLDTISKISVAAPATDPNSVDLLSFNRQLYIYEQRGAKKALIGQMILQQQKQSLTAQGKSVTWEGFEILEELRQKNTWRGLVINDQPFEVAIRSLLPSGWRAAVEDGLGNYSDRLDGVPKWKAISDAVLKKGLHIRLGRAVRMIEIGAFGADSGLVIASLSQPSIDLPQASNLALTASLEVVGNGYDVVNKIVPIAGGRGDAALTLKRATASSPYAVQSEAANGQPHYYLADSASIALYGQIERVVPLPNLLPVEATSASLINAADLLHGWACAWLTRHKDPQYSYRCTLAKYDGQLLPGDKVRLRYQGPVTQGSEVVDWLAIDADFWVTGIDETYGTSGRSANLTISNVDMNEMDFAAALANGISEVKDGQKAVEMVTQPNKYEKTVTVTAGTSTVVTVELSAFAVDLARARVKLTRSSVYYPDSLSVVVDGQTITNGVDGEATPFLGGTASLMVTLDIEEALMIQIEAAHTLTLNCLSGSGQVTLTFDLVEVIAGIRG